MNKSEHKLRQLELW